MTTKTKFFKTLNTLYFAILGASLLFGFAVYFVKKDSFLTINYDGSVFYYIVPIVAIIEIVLSIFFYKAGITKIKTASSLIEKLQMYNTAFLISNALLEAAILFGIVAFFIIGNQLYLIIAALVALFYLAKKPSNSHIETALDLSPTQAREFEE
jgi:hypothetical protein